MSPGGPRRDYANYYQGMWDCSGEHPDELSFRRGDLIYILSKVRRGGGSPTVILTGLGLNREVKR